ESCDHGLQCGCCGAAASGWRSDRCQIRILHSPVCGHRAAAARQCRHLSAPTAIGHMGRSVKLIIAAKRQYNQTKVYLDPLLAGRGSRVGAPDWRNITVENGIVREAAPDAN